jgi:hypothetical protein
MTMRWFACLGLVTWLSTGTAGCALEVAETEDVAAAEDHEHVGEAEHAIELQSLSGACYWGSGQYWCQDYYTKKWCTGSKAGHGWDWTSCDWDGWNGDRYCDGGWQWAQSHQHCP